MLIAGLVSYTAIARDGSGTASVFLVGNPLDQMDTGFDVSVPQLQTRFMSILDVPTGRVRYPAPLACR